MRRLDRSLGFVLMMAAAAISCDKSSPTSPTPPSSVDTPVTTQPQPPPPNVGGNGQIQVNAAPNPVPFSGQAITDAAGCASLKNTWFYDHVFTETGGTEVKFTNRVDSFDGFVVNNLSNLSIVVPANGTLTLHSRWCSGNGIKHTAQSIFSGTDSKGNTVTITGPLVELMAPSS